MFDTKYIIGNKCKEAEDIGFCKWVREENCGEILWNEEKVALARHCKKFLSEMERPINYEVTKQDIEITETITEKIRKERNCCGGKSIF